MVSRRRAFCSILAGRLAISGGFPSKVPEMIRDIAIPDIGDFTDILVVEVAAKVGDRIVVDDTILMLESDKATLDIPAPFSGVVTEVIVTDGDRVRQGTVVMRILADAQNDPKVGAPSASADQAKPTEDHASLVVIGAGPGGYTAAFRAADLGRRVVLIDARASLGGVCLNAGCIPSKALLHISKVINDTAEADHHGLSFGKPTVDLDKIRDFKNGIISKLTGGLDGLAKRRKVTIIQGTAQFSGANRLTISTADGPRELSFDQAIIAVGSEPMRLGFLPEDDRIIDSTGALALVDIPKRLLVIGGGIIGLEMAQVYHALGAEIEIVEQAGQIIPGVDGDVVAPLAKRMASKGVTIRTDTKVTAVEANHCLTVTFSGKTGSSTGAFDRVLVAVGRVPNGAKLAAEFAGVTVTPQGFIPVDAQMRTSQPHIFAIGDVVGQPMLAHKAVHEAKVAAEVACGEKVAFEPACIPSVAYTDPEVAWVGLTETQAKAAGIKVRKGSFPWMASGRSLSFGREDGMTKLLFDAETGKVLGGAIVGPNAGELISEVAFAIEMGADAQDIAHTVHPHPTLSETVAFAAEAYLGTLTDL
jgi:dihydrolipoamide dehydrogenase